MVNRPFPQYKKVNNLTSHLNLLNIKKTMTYDDGNPDTVHKKVAGLNLLMGSEPSCLHLEGVSMLWICLFCLKNFC